MAILHFKFEYGNNFLMPHPGVIFNVFLNKLEPILIISATDELPKGGSVRQNTHF